MLTADSPWRSLGNVSPDRWRRQLEAAGSPIAAEWETAYDAAHPHTALALAMLEVESRYFTRFNANAPANKNPLNLRPPTGGGYLAFATLTDGIRAWRDRITDPRYKGGIYDKTRSVIELVERYAPAFDNNDPSAYAAIVVARVAAWLGTDAAATAHSEGDNAQMSTKPTILVIAGHRSYNDAGNPIEKGLTPGIAAAYRDAFRAAGYDVTWLQEADGDNDPDDTVGGLDTVSRKAGEWCARQSNGVLLDLHFEGTAPQIRGVFAITPDVTGLRTGAPVVQPPADTWENNVRDRELGQAITDGISAVTGLPIRQGLRAPGLMDESQTGVGGQGWRLATFAYTAPHHLRVVRLVIEHGAFTNPQDLAIIKGAGFNQKCALAAVNAVNAVYGVAPSKPQPPAIEPSPIWWKPGATGVQKRAHDGAVALAMLGEVTAARGVPIRRDANSASAIVARMKQGDTARIAGTYRAPNGQRWVFVETEPGKWGRALWSAFSPRWPTVDMT